MLKLNVKLSEFPRRIQWHRRETGLHTGMLLQVH